jgi:CheY-like chemotaxis protein
MNRQLTMLIVDDMEVERISFAEIFKDEYQILEAENGKQAMEQLEQQKVHIVLLDLCMPVMDGFEVIREMKQQDKYADIPIVAKTAIDEKTEVKALEAGADEYIFSPCDPAIVKKRVHNLVEKYILEREKIRAQLEKEQEMGRAKELFLARMSHELRTPINGILGISQLAHYKDAEVREDFKKIRYQAEYLWELVNDVLDMAAIDNGKMTIRHVAFSLNEVVSEVSGLFYSQCRMKRIYFYFRVDNVTHEYLIGDAIRVKQVLVNLLSNSFKFTEKGGTIEVCMSELDVDDSRTVLHITVRDTGCGISDKALEKIWEPFEQEQHENGKYYGGSGLGLPITKSIVEQMHGTIDVASEYNVGSKFIVDIPFEIGKSIVREKRKFRSLKVFLVNNDEIALHYMMSTLTRLGIRYDSSTDGKEIIRILKEAYERGEGYDICFVNWQMPGGYGKKLVREMREIFDRDTLKIVTSSYDTEDYEEEMRGAGVDYILKKPVLQSQVYSMISEICSVPEAEKNKTEDYDFSGKRALLAEDNAVNAEVFQGFLKAVNAEVECADNGEAALSRYQNMPDYYYDMIFMDLNMPIMDGYEAAKSIRGSKKPDASDIPILAVTANAMAKDIVKVHEAGMNERITKPVQRELLYQTMEKYIL